MNSSSPPLACATGDVYLNGQPTVDHVEDEESCGLVSTPTASGVEHRRNASPPTTVSVFPTVPMVRIADVSQHQPPSFPVPGAGLDLSAILQAQAVPVSEVAASTRSQVTQRLAVALRLVKTLLSQLHCINMRRIHSCDSSQFTRIFSLVSFDTTQDRGVSRRSRPGPGPCPVGHREDANAVRPSHLRQDHPTPAARCEDGARPATASATNGRSPLRRRLCRGGCSVRLCRLRAFAGLFTVISHTRRAVRKEMTSLRRRRTTRPRRRESR